MTASDICTIIAAASGFAGSIILALQADGLFKAIANAIRFLEENDKALGMALVNPRQDIILSTKISQQIKNVERTGWLRFGFLLLAVSAFFWALTIFV